MMNVDEIPGVYRTAGHNFLHTECGLLDFLFFSSAPDSFLI